MRPRDEKPGWTRRLNQGPGPRGASHRVGAPRRDTEGEVGVGPVSEANKRAGMRVGGVVAPS